jgi:ubiquinone/menaquinone biosynthesis C-methylase UbiE
MVVHMKCDRDCHHVGVDEVRHPLFARLYTRVLAPSFTRMGGADLRSRLLADLKGTVVEVGCGTGDNFAHYPDTVERIVAVEPEAYLREQAAAHSDERVELRDAVASRLPVGDGEADAVVFSLVLCSVDQASALAEARRVLGSGGEVRFLEHVRAHEPGLTRRTQRALDATVWPLLFGGCHLSRDTVAAIERAGFTVTDLERFWFPEGARGPSSAAVRGAAVPV